MSSKSFWEQRRIFLYVWLSICQFLGKTAGNIQRRILQYVWTNRSLNLVWYVRNVRFVLFLFGQIGVVCWNSENKIFVVISVSYLLWKGDFFICSVEYPLILGLQATYREEFYNMLGQIEVSILVWYVGNTYLFVKQ